MNENLIHQFIEVSGIRIHYRKIDSPGPVFTLLHGFGASLFSWHEVIEPISAYGKVIAYDRPGFGFSSRPQVKDQEQLNPYDNEAQIELIIQLLDRLEVDKSILIGHSAGGLLALEAASRYPDRVKGLLLIAPAVLGHKYVTNGTRWFLRKPLSRAIFKRAVRMVLLRKERILRRAWYHPEDISAQTKEGYFAPFEREDTEDALYWISEASDFEFSDEEITTIKTPAMVIQGAEDRIVPPEVGKRVSVLMQDSIYREIPACGHVPHEEKPREFLELFKGFMDQVKEKM